MISIITVSLNSEQTILGTLLSVLNQSYNDIEYIIMDGLSTDNTVSLVNSYTHYFKEKGIKLHIVSEQDKGIYDAMNKAILLASTPWVLFLNCGDELYDNSVIEKLSVHLRKKVDMIFGNTLMDFGSYSLPYYSYTQEPSLSNPMPFIHQSVIVRTHLLKTKKFNLTYKIAADYDFFYQLRQVNTPFLAINQFISKYEAINGMSSKSSLLCAKEKMIINRCFHTRVSYYITCRNYYIKWILYKCNLTFFLNFIKKINLNRTYR